MSGTVHATRALTSHPHLDDPYYQQALIDTAEMCGEFAASARTGAAAQGANVLQMCRAAMLGPRPEAPYSSGVSLSHAGTMARIVASIDAGGALRDTADGRKGIQIVSRLTGLEWRDAAMFCSDASRFPAEDCAAAWQPVMSPPDHRVVGFVYAARACTLPGRIKIGFTTDLAKRQKALSSQVFSPVWVVGVRVATMLHEWCLHQAIARPADHEWHPEECAPEWLLFRETNKTAAQKDAA
jgi:hypothetical protein